MQQLVERDSFGKIINQNKQIENVVSGERKAKQILYRELLDTQLQYAKELKGYGNMTEFEKKMNRVDLQAYKNFDKNVYSLVPGINSALNVETASIGVNKYPSKKRNMVQTGFNTTSGGEEAEQRKYDIQNQRMS